MVLRYRGGGRTITKKKVFYAKTQQKKKKVEPLIVGASLAAHRPVETRELGTKEKVE